MDIQKRFSKTYSWLIFAVFFIMFLIIGLRIFDDFGPVSEERNQIDAGHIIWAYITGDNSHYPELPSLENYMNRYYGQGATFITVLLEAVFGFTWDVNRIWKIRRLWNFFCFCCSLICLFLMLKQRYNRFIPAFFGVCSLILLPRMFPEVFYNDRDPLFLSFLVFTFFALILFLKKTSIWTALLLGIMIAFAVNTRMFGLMLFVPLLLIFAKYPLKRRHLIPVLLVFFAVWYGLSPIAWKDPIGVIRTSVTHLTTRQRMLDTNGSSTLLFAGKYYLEQDLPWFYLPLWMLISTPLALIGSACLGAAICFQKSTDHTCDDYFIIDISLAVFFLVFIVGVPIIRPTLYSGWRHFYFLNLSLVWFAAFALDRILKIKKSPVKGILLILEGVSLIASLIWVISAHPYEGVYYNPIFRKFAANNFERDTGYISTMECLEYLSEISPDQKIEVMNANAFIPFSLIGLPKSVRERFSTIDWKMQRIPMKYVIFNYNNMKENDQVFPYYAPIYSIERNGTKLVEIFQRTNNKLLKSDDVVESIHTASQDNSASNMLSDDPKMIWISAEPHNLNEEIVLRFKNDTEISSLEVFPGEYTEACEKLKFYTSEDGNSDWQIISAERFGTNGWLFSSPPKKYLRIQSDINSNHPWQIRQILIYAK